MFLELCSFTTVVSCLGIKHITKNLAVLVLYLFRDIIIIIIIQQIISLLQNRYIRIKITTNLKTN